MALVDAPNPVPARQKFYQAAYKAHNRLYRIGRGSRWYYLPYVLTLWGTLGATFYSAGRKVMGHNTWFGKD